MSTHADESANKRKPLSITATLQDFLWFKKQVIAEVKSKDGGAAYLSGSLQDEMNTLQLQEEALLKLRSEKKEEAQDKVAKLRLAIIKLQQEIAECAGLLYAKIINGVH